MEAKYARLRTSSGHGRSRAESNHPLVGGMELEKIESFRRNKEIIPQSPEKRGCFQNKHLKINYLCEFQK